MEKRSRIQQYKKARVPVFFFGLFSPSQHTAKPAVLFFIGDNCRIFIFHRSPAGFYIYRSPAGFYIYRSPAGFSIRPDNRQIYVLTRKQTGFYPETKKMITIILF